MFAVKNEKTDKVAELVKIPGIDLNTRNKSGKTLEQVARDKSLAKILKLLPGTIEHKIETQEHKIETQEHKIETLTAELRRLRSGGQQRSGPSCPVCMEDFQRND